MKPGRVEFSTYPCSKLGATALVKLHYKRLPDPNPKDVLARFECNDCRACGVATSADRRTWTYDWSQCEHPLSGSSPGPT